MLWFVLTPLVVALTVVTLSMGASVVQAQQEERLGVAEEARLRDLAQDLRCVVCQNESIADSQAGLAIDLRREIRGQIKEGQSDEEIVAYLVARYGDFVTYKPPLRPQTYVLWFGPFVLLALLLIALLRHVRRQPLMREDEMQAIIEAPPSAIDEASHDKESLAQEMARLQQQFGRTSNQRSNKP